MSSRRPKPDSRAQPAPRRPPIFPPNQETVDPRWLLKALTLTAVAAVVCAWLALCLLYYLGAWQLVLHPSHAVDRTPAAVGLPFEPVRFDAAETGQPRLTGWWIPALPTGAQPQLTAPARYAADTILYLHNGSGSLSDTLPALLLLHSTGINIFALDYRGFGLSERSPHPTSASMQQDTAAALGYLTGTRHVPAARIIPYGAGLGASLAANLAASHPDLPAVILDNPDPDPTATAIAAHRSRLVPIRLLYHEHFEIAPVLATLTTPKLLLAGGPNGDASAQPGSATARQPLFQAAHSPRLTVTLPAQDTDPAYLKSLSRFLDQYLPTP